MGKLKEVIKELTPLTRKCIYFGTAAALCMAISAVIMKILSFNAGFNLYYLSKWANDMAKYSGACLAEAIIIPLLLDFYIKRNK